MNRFVQTGRACFNFKNQGIVMKIYAMLLLLVLGVEWGIAAEFSDISYTPQTGCYEKLEVRFTVTTLYDNPYNPDEVTIDGIFTCPSGVQHTVPAFWFQDYKLSADPQSGAEKLTAHGSPEWRIRYAPMETGHYSFYLQLTDKDGTVSSAPAYFNSVNSSAKGFIRVDDNEQYLSFDNGDFYLPMGQNVGWADDKGSYRYNTWMNAMADAGENWMRIWCTHFSNGQLLEWNANHYTGWYHGLGRYSQQAAWKWDYMVNLAEDLGLYIQMVTQHHGQFSQSTNPNWDENPFNQANGGFLSSGDQFFSDDSARQFYKKKMRYTIARWGYSTAILAWELWNEVQFTDNYTTNYPVVAQWHGEMADYIHSIDPWLHLVTTSARDEDSLIWSLPGLDVTQNHYYGSGVILAIQSRHLKMAQYNKPNIIGEFGDDWQTGGGDVTGTSIHHGIWAATMVGGGAMPWWWDNYIHPNDLYYHWQALAAYWQGEDLRSGVFAPVENDCQGGPISAAGARAYPGLGWTASLQKEFTVRQDGSVPGIEELSQYLHGSDKANMGREAKFHVRFDQDFTFGLYIRDVSTWDPGVLKIFIDDATKPLLNKAPQKEKSYTVSVPAGEHTLRVYNAGTDWFLVEYYEFSGIQVPAALAYSFSNGTTTYAWILDRNYNAGTSPNGTISGASLVLDQHKNGDFIAEQWNTYTGRAIHSQKLHAGDNLVVPLQDFEGDIAVKIKPAATWTGDDSQHPRYFKMLPNYPNPFNSGTTIVYEIMRNAQVTLQLYDCTGRFVATLYRNRDNTGAHQLHFTPGSDLSSGVYFLKMQCGNEAQTHKIVHLR